MTIHRRTCVLPLVCALTACNGWPGSGADGLPPRRPAGSITGNAVDGAVASADVYVYAFVGGMKGARLGAGTTGDDGSYSVSITARDQPVLVEVMGGHYTEEASGKKVDLKDDQHLWAVGYYHSGRALTLMVTPLTHIAAGLASYEVGQGMSVPAAVQDANAQISKVFGVDIATTPASDITAAGGNNIAPESYLYGFYLAGISSWSQWAGEQNHTPAHSVYTSIALSQIMYDDIVADGRLDGRAADKLAFGVVPLNRDVYRVAFTQHMMAMAGGEKNHTPMTINDLLPAAHKLAASRNAVFDGEAPGGSDKPGAIVSVEPDGLYHNGVFEFAVAVRGLVQATSVGFSVDDNWIGDAKDPNLPAIAVDTRNYADGEHHISVLAKDALGKEAKGNFAIRVDNTAPFVNITSPPATNQAAYHLTGNYGDNGAGVKSIRVGEQDVQPADDGTWGVDITLNAGRNTIPVVVQDRIGNEYQSEAVVDLDTTPPIIDTSAGHSVARFSDGDGKYHEAPLQDSNDTPLYFLSDKLDLGGTAIERHALDARGIPYFAFRATDPDAPDSAVTAQMQYEKAGVAGKWRDVTPVGGEYLIPLASEVLQADWYKTTPSDEHVIRIGVTDRAGNRTGAEFHFKADVHVADFKWRPTKDIGEEIFANTPFTERTTLYGMPFGAIVYGFTNTTGKSFYLSVDDAADYSAELTVEKMVREHQARTKTTTEWRIRPIANPGVQCPVALDWKPVTSLQNYTAAGWQTVVPPAPQYGDAAPLDSDQLPTATETPWADAPDFDAVYYRSVTNGFFGYNLEYEYDYVEDIHRSPMAPAGVRRWQMQIRGQTLTCPDVRYFQQNQVHGYESMPGYPRNVSSEFKESAKFSASGFDVVDTTAGAPITPYKGWYAVPAGHDIAITKRVTTPQLNVYNDTDVGTPDTFASYAPHNYDKEIIWSVGRGITVTVAPDAGEANLFAVSTRGFSIGEGAKVYRLAR